MIGAALLEHQSLGRSGAFRATLFGTGAVVLWLFTSIATGVEAAAVAGTALRWLVAAQLLAAAIIGPAMNAEDRRGTILYTGLAIVTIPWPLYALLLRLADGSLAGLGVLQLLVALTLLAGGWVGRGIDALTDEAWRVLARRLFQAVTGLGVWLAAVNWLELAL